MKTVKVVFSVIEKKKWQVATDDIKSATIAPLF